MLEFSKTSYEFRKITFRIGVPYCSRDEDILSKHFEVKAP
jgi:hypothetical protein